MPTTYSDAVHRDHCAYHPERDPLLAVFLKLHVASDYESDAKFLQNATAVVRSSDAVKKAKFLKKESLVLDLLRRPLTPLTFYALALAYGVVVDVEVGKVAFSTGEGKVDYVVKDGRLIKRVRWKGDAPLLHVQPAKPLNAASYYNAGELTCMADIVGLPRTPNKATAYDALKKYLDNVLQGF
jgi:hypothetical protein